MVARGSMLELLRIDPDTDKLVSSCCFYCLLFPLTMPTAVYLHCGTILVRLHSSCERRQQRRISFCIFQQGESC